MLKIQRSKEVQNEESAFDPLSDLISGPKFQLWLYIPICKVGRILRLCDDKWRPPKFLHYGIPSHPLFPDLIKFANQV